MTCYFQRMADLKIVSNMSAITLEESTPMIATDATLLAPQEIVGKLFFKIYSCSDEYFFIFFSSFEGRP